MDTHATILHLTTFNLQKRAAWPSGNASVPCSITNLEFRAETCYPCQVPWFPYVSAVNATKSLYFKPNNGIYKIHTPTNALFIKLDKVFKFTLTLITLTWRIG